VGEVEEGVGDVVMSLPPFREVEAVALAAREEERMEVGC
jgi:hypothetical protein